MVKNTYTKNVYPRNRHENLVDTQWFEAYEIIKISLRFFRAQMTATLKVVILVNFKANNSFHSLTNNIKKYLFGEIQYNTNDKHLVKLFPLKKHVQISKLMGSCTPKCFLLIPMPDCIGFGCENKSQDVELNSKLNKTGFGPVS